MRKKLLIVGILCTFLLTSLTPVSSLNEKNKEETTLSSPWIEIVKPRAGSIHFGPVILRCKGSSDVDSVSYMIKADWDRNGNQYWMGPWVENSEKPNYRKIWIFPIVRGLQKVTIHADGYQYDYDENGNVTGEHWVCGSQDITIYRWF